MQTHMPVCSIEKAGALKPGSWEVVSSLGQLEWERARVRMGYVMPPA